MSGDKAQIDAHRQAFRGMGLDAEMLGAVPREEAWRCHACCSDVAVPL